MFDSLALQKYGFLTEISLFFGFFNFFFVICNIICFSNVRLQGSSCSIFASAVVLGKARASGMQALPFFILITKGYNDFQINRLSETPIPPNIQISEIFEKCWWLVL